MVAGHLQEKNGLYYIVLSYKDANGKRKTPWFATNLPVKGNKRRAEALLLEKRQSFLVPDASPAQADEGEDMLFTDFLRSWLPIAKSTIKLTTYASYVSMTQGVIIPYFQALGITLKKLTASDQRKHGHSLPRRHPQGAQVCCQDGLDFLQSRRQNRAPKESDLHRQLLRQRGDQRTVSGFEGPPAGTSHQAGGLLRTAPQRGPRPQVERHRPGCQHPHDPSHRHLVQSGGASTSR